VPVHSSKPFGVPSKPELRVQRSGSAATVHDRIALRHAHPDSSTHRPRVEVSLVHDADALHLSFDVWDQYVIARHTEDQSPVCLDSCVEFFVQPAGCPGYFNFEFNCIGTILAHFNPAASPGNPILLPTRCEGGVQAQSSETRAINDEIRSPLLWSLGASIPISLFTTFGNAVPPGPGTVWLGNFYKCADHSSHPHWLSWADIGERLSFHQPDRFGLLTFA
jgi:hypothetical protein